jgi:2-oxoisovalerate dehydrogenase E2 component (dihydrolipoyl transacylase)
MATEVKLPDVVEGVQDVTISRWLVQAGDTVKAGQPILEVATEKVDTQIEAPVDGTVLQLSFGEGEIVPADAVLALIGSSDEKVPLAPARAPEEATGRPSAGGNGQAAPESAPPADDIRATPVARRVAEEEHIPLDQVKGTGAGGQVTKEDVLALVAQKGRPQAGQEALVTEEGAGDEAQGGARGEAVGLTVQRLAVEHNINLRDVARGRPLGAITENDVLRYAEALGRAVPEPKRRRPQWQPAPAAPAALQQPAATPAAAAAPRPAPVLQAKPGAGEELVPHTRMRQLVAKNTAQAAFSIPHVTTMWDVNMTAVLEHRQAHKAEFAAEGVNLTVTAYLIQATIAGLRAVPAANSTWTDEGVILKRYYNVGLAVALPMDQHGLGGLIVPVIKNAGDLSMSGLARAVNDLSQRARANKLTAEDLQGGTFSVSNYGTSGSRFQTPVIVNGQAGILGVGAIEKRPVVVSQGSPLEANRGDYLAFQPLLTLGFSYDHRILDGATADAFCAAVKNALENWK